MEREFTKPLKIVFIERIHEYDDVYTFVFMPDKDLTFVAGQNAHVVIPWIEEGADFENRRSLSFASSPHEKNIQFTLHTGSGSQYKKAFMEMVAGDILYIVKVKGTIVPPLDTSLPLVLIAGGVGITPFRSILLNAVCKKLPTKISLIHVSSGAYLYEDELNKLPYEQKRIRREEVMDTVTKMTKENKETLYFVVGSTLFLETIEEVLKENNIPEDSIRVSRFKRYGNLLD